MISNELLIAAGGTGNQRTSRSVKNQDEDFSRLLETQVCAALPLRGSLHSQKTIKEAVDMEPAPRISLAPLITLNDGVQIPQLGFGVWKLDDIQAYEASRAALAAGYRHLDTAMSYGNEAGVGRAVAECELLREHIFITTKLWNTEQGFDSTLRAFDASMQRLGLETLDLYLIHWAIPKKSAYRDTWKAFVRLKQEGRVRSIGVSNFNVEHLVHIIDDTGVVPSVNQIEIHPDFNQANLSKWCHERGITTASWSPLGQGGDLLKMPLFAEIAQRHGKTPAHVILRWHLQNGHVPIPRSTNAERMAANLNVFDFELSSHELKAIAHLKQTGRLGPDPETIEMGL
ncbi:aldo/keto reductase [Pseudomonas sp. CBS]|uniref:aldo/keto reductase n=1 Tax=Pseudomonas sp. CBS TaxID=2971912 RepID=UPI0021AC876C|nr:aldo/keto reductase [Pseudomonas sp. CBS]WEL64664.1 aldo/keto reductase [Pseudomonas sp. CBSPGW29]WEL68130.1 aldo/keto reductase [Pseudomonas sp. CBSPCGW29]WEL75150.1 aldo/keto reductase [Pseudomonas sp. CBSPAW29]WEL80605.1 aldo/keto reductase [Pseudomonas sp. CBSPCAW29]UVH51772.1 aldo/keto reductase [Pseudomonas sp. CBS]